MAIPISYSEIYGQRPTEVQLTELISSFKSTPTFISLAMWSLMFSFCEGDGEKYQYLQNFFIHNLLRHNVQEEVVAAALNNLGEITLAEVLEEYAREEHQPLSTFNGILDKFLRARGLDEKCRYKWSVGRGEEILDSLLRRFQAVPEP